jgi:hypothetical protein
MAKRKSGQPTKTERAKRIIRNMTSRGAQRSSLVQTRVERAGISVRTYRYARKQMKALSIRRSWKHRTKGSGRWYTKSRGKGK